MDLNENDNPFASPLSDGPSRWKDDKYGLRREGKVLLAAKQAEFPDRCVKCNAPADGYRLKRVLYWHNPLYYLIILVCNILIYAVVAMIVRETATYHVGLCHVHRAKRRNAIIVAWSCVLGFVALIVLAFQYEIAALFVISLLLLLVGLLLGILGARVIYAKQIDKEYSWIQGAGPEFLDSIEAESMSG